MFIIGKTTFYRKVLKFDNSKWPEMVYSEIQSFTPKWYHCGRSFTVNAGVKHWFRVSNFPLVFINFAKFKQGNEPKSAAVDFNR